jgi:hypothetical protein
MDLNCLSYHISFLFFNFFCAYMSIYMTYLMNKNIGQISKATADRLNDLVKLWAGCKTHLDMIDYFSILR